MKGMFSSKKQKILLIINILIIILYFVFDIAGMALFVTPEFKILFKVVSIILPWGIIYFTAPRTDNGDKFTVSVWGLILIFYYIYNGNVQIKGNEYIHSLTGGELITDELRFNMIVGIVLSCFVIVSGWGILYRIKEKRKSNEKIKVDENVEKAVEYIYYDEKGNVSETPTRHRVIK